MPACTEAIQLARSLSETQHRIVFAESCTAGMVAALLAQVPGISEIFCGSAVTYREATKQAWLDVSTAALEHHTAVSEPVAGQMALGVLTHTPEADIAASITGHLGPEVAAEIDGIVFIGITRRTSGPPQLIQVTRHELSARDRSARQHEAALLVLRQTICAIDAL